MESIKKFLSIDFGDGDGSGRGYGFSDGSGCGNAGDEHTDGSGCGSGYGWDNESGSSCMSFSFNDYSGSGCGHTFTKIEDTGRGIKKYNTDFVRYIDNIPTAIQKIKNNIARGYIINTDLTTTPCYVAKIENCFAHGKTIHEAVSEAQNKTFEKSIVGKRIERFWKCHNRVDKYPMRDFYEWHSKLTDSCKMGRDQFVKDHGLDLNNDYFTVDEFIKLCENDYGGDIIKRLKR